MNSTSPPVPDPASSLPLPSDWPLLERRNALRLAMLERRLGDVDETLETLEAEWWRKTPIAASEYGYLALPTTIFDFATVGLEQRAALMKAWLDACPASYHAHYIYGHDCFGRALAIRTADWAENVGETQWPAISMACAIAADHLLQAIALSERPAFAVTSMMEMALHFGEPGLHAVFGTDGKDGLVKREDVGDETFDAALAHLEEQGLKPLERFPTRPLPDLPVPQPDEETDALYWLHYGLRLRPQWPNLLGKYADYLTPRWGGEEGEIEKFAMGPLCAPLTEQQRNIVRRPGFADAVWRYPKPDDSPGIRSFEATLAEWLARDLPSSFRFVGLTKLATLTNSALHDSDRAYGLHVEAVGHCDGPHDYLEAGPEFRDFAWHMLISRRSGEDGAFKTVLERAVRRSAEPSTILAAAAVAYQFGLWNFPADPAAATRLLDRVAELDRIYHDDWFPPSALCRMLWDGEWPEEAFFLTSELAERRVTEPSGMMYSVRSGRFADVGAQYADPDDEFRWLERAVEEGAPTAFHNMANWIEFENDMTKREDFEKARDLFRAAADSGLEASRLRLAGLQQGFGSLEEQREALDDLKSLAATTTDDAIVAKAFAGIVRAYKHGRGAPRSEFAAAQWLERLKEVLPGDEFIPELERDVYGDGWWEAAWRFLTTIFESQPAAEHLPPK